MTRPTWIALGLIFTIGCGARGQSRDSSTNTDPLDDVSGQELYRRGRLLAGSGDFIRAEQYIAAAIQRGFPEDEAMPALMNVCIEGSRLAAALSYAEPYLARHPSQWSLRMLVASIYMGLEQDERARDELERVVQDAADEPPQAHYFLGVLYRDRLDDAERAAEHFGRYLALAPEGEHVEEARAGLPRPPPDPSALPRRVDMSQEQTEAPLSALPRRVDMPREQTEAPPSNEEGAH